VLDVLGAVWMNPGGASVGNRSLISLLRRFPVGLFHLHLACCAPPLPQGRWGPAGKLGQGDQNSDQLLIFCTIATRCGHRVLLAVLLRLVVAVARPKLSSLFEARRFLLN
jgi:hypothetical protein